MAETIVAPEVVLRREMARYLNDIGLAKFRETGAYQPKEIGMYTHGGALPTGKGNDNALMLRSLSSIPSGRADMLYRIQFEVRLLGTLIEVENFAAGLADAIDQKGNVPPGQFIAWCSLFSQLPISPDASGRAGMFATYHFLGRRRIRE